MIIPTPSNSWSTKKKLAKQHETSEENQEAQDVANVWSWMKKRNVKMPNQRNVGAGGLREGRSWENTPHSANPIRYYFCFHVSRSS